MPPRQWHTTYSDPKAVISIVCFVHQFSIQNCMPILNCCFASVLNSAQQTIPRSPQPRHTTTKNPHNNPRLHFPSYHKRDHNSQSHYKELPPLHHNTTMYCYFTTNAITCSCYSTTASTATYSSNTYHSLEGHGGDVGRVVSGHNSKHERALEHI